MILLYHPHKHITFLSIHLSLFFFKRFLPGGSNKLPNNPKKVGEALNTISGTPPISPKPPTFPISQAPSSSQPTTNHPTLQKTTPMLPNPGPSITEQYQQSHPPFSPSEQMRIDLDYQDRKNSGKFSTETSKTTKAQQKSNENDTTPSSSATSTREPVPPFVFPYPKISTSGLTTGVSANLSHVKPPDSLFPKTLVNDLTPLPLEPLPFKEQIDSLGNDKSGDSIKPSEIPPIMKKPFKFKSQSGKNQETLINKDTKPSDITDEQLKEEMIKRELIKVDPGQNTVFIKLQDNSDHLLGASKHKVKLSNLGQAYNIKVTAKTNKEPTFADNNLPNDPNFKIIIIVPPKSNDDLFIEDGKQKHLIVVYYSSTNRYFSFSYFTGKGSGDFLSSQRFKEFQKQQENDFQESGQTKQQYGAFFEHPVEIKEEDIVRVKWDEEYLENLPETSKELLQEKWNKIKEKAIEPFNKSGITKEHALEMCKDHDKEANKAKPKHPLTDDQIKQNQTNKEKQINKLKNLSENEDSTIGN